MPAGALAKGEEARLFRDPDIGVGGVREDEEVERLDRAGLLNRFISRLQAGEYAGGRFIIGRHQHRGALAQGGQRRTGVDAERRAAPADHREHAAHRVGEGEADPREQDDEQRQHDGFQRCQPADREHQIHLIGREDGEQPRPADDEGTAREQAGGQRAPVLRHLPQRLHRHGERGVLRQRRGERRARWHVAFGYEVHR